MLAYRADLTILFKSAGRIDLNLTYDTKGEVNEIKKTQLSPRNMY